MTLQKRIEDLSGIEYHIHIPLEGYEKTHYCYRHSVGWVFFINNKVLQEQAVDGWKFHISIKTSALEFIWDYLETLLLNGSLGFKVLNPGRHPNQSGRQIVLYTFQDPQGQPMQEPKELLTLFRKIEQVLRIFDVPVGKSPQSSRKIAGSQYLTYRHDTHMDTRQYVPKDKAKEINPKCPHNPYGYENPYENFCLTDLKERFFSLPGKIYKRHEVETLHRSVARF